MDAATYDFIKDRLTTTDGVVITLYKGTRKNVHIPDTLGGKKVLAIQSKGSGRDGITSVFMYKGLEQVRFPSTLQHIGIYEFAANKLTSITIPNSMTKIPWGAFVGNQLTSIMLPNTVTVIGSDAFAYNRLTSVTIPNSVTSIVDGAFQNNKLTSVNIPNSVTYLGKEAFVGNQLTSVQLPKHLTQNRNPWHNEYVDIATAFDPGVTITYRP